MRSAGLRSSSPITFLGRKSHNLVTGLAFSYSTQNRMQSVVRSPQRVI